MPEHGGKRTPGNPAPVSGPGQLSQRTDGGPQRLRDPLGTYAGGIHPRDHEGGLAKATRCLADRGRGATAAAVLPLFDFRAPHAFG